MDAKASEPKKCPGLNCGNNISDLKCPTCLKMGIDSFFCSNECFKRSWAEHKTLHKSTRNPLRKFVPPSVVSEPDPETGLYNPFPTFPFTGPLRPVYPLSERRKLPAAVVKPEWSEDGRPKYKLAGRNNITILDKKGQDGMRKVCRLAREVLDIAAKEVKPGVTTDHIDEVVHKACIERNVGSLSVSISQAHTRQSYPSPLNYVQFPKSVCTSVNEIICHGIPDQRKLENGDIVNIDVTLYHGGYHGDLNETYYVGEKASADPESVRVTETSRECLEKAIELVKPGMLFRDPGNVIEKHAKSRDCSVIKTYCGHGINTLFHCAPNVPHYAKNKAVGTAKPGMCFTIEPMISLGSYKDKTWPDDWTSATVDGSRTAQFEHTLLVTEDGVEVLTARKADSPGGPIKMPVGQQNGSTDKTNGDGHVS
ncbi:MAG: hypothetical protein Q9160_005215 [Pyrenula sp. 1 TL-2023]